VEEEEEEEEEALTWLAMVDVDGSIDVAVAEVEGFAAACCCNSCLIASLIGVRVPACTSHAVTKHVFVVPSLVTYCFLPLTTFFSPDIKPDMMRKEVSKEDGWERLRKCVGVLNRTDLG